MSSEQEQLQAAIAALEARRLLLGDGVVDMAVAPLQAKLAGLTGAHAGDEVSAQTLKQVTILFLDVVGSTKLIQDLDLEDIHAVMNGALASCTAIVKSYGGRVLEYAGDSLLAVFGADEASEDDAEQAVRTGLALLAEGRRLGEEVERLHGRPGFNLRVGLHTGGVLLSAGGDAEGSIRGVAVNIAARMEQSAPPGGLRISHTTYSHVRGVFDVEPQPPIEVKGVAEPILTYLVQRAKPRAFRIATRGIEGVETRMIGREDELEVLEEAFKRLYQEARFEAISIVADAGLGKSRLLYEFETWAEQRPEESFIFQGRGSPHAQTQPYGLLRDILTWRLQLAGGDSMEAAKEKTEQSIVPLFVDDEGEDTAQAHAHLLGHLFGLDFSDSKHVKGILDDPKQIRNRGFHAAAQILRRVHAREKMPIVLKLEDLHWADDGSLDFLEYLAQVDHDVPILMLSLARPTLFDRRVDWGSTLGVHRRIDLEPLGKDLSRQLANELLKKLPEIPAALRALITGGAEGNPFYMEELVKMLIDQGAIETGPEQWTLHADKLLATKVPSTLTGVLQARLDGLPAVERRALQQASVIGLVFWDAALAALDAHASAALPSLVHRELILPRRDADLAGMREFTFRHQILHHVTYDTVLKRERRALHAKTAAWLASLAGSHTGDFLGATAEHYERAGDNASACEFFARAAEQARTRFAHEAVLGYVLRALALIPASDPGDQWTLRWRLLDARERTLDIQGRRDEQRADLEALEQLADALDDDRRRAVLALRRTSLALSNADYRVQESTARQTMALAEKAGEDELRLNAQRLLATALARLGDPAAGKTLAHQGLVEARARGLRRAEARLLSTLAAIAGWQGDQVAVLEYTQQELLITRELGTSLREAMALGNLGSALLTLGELSGAQRHLEESLKLHRVVGNRVMEPLPLANLALLALWRGNDSQALALAHSALEIAVAVQAPDYEAVALCLLGEAEQALGRHAAAALAFERAQQVARSIDYAVQFDAAAGRARVALAQNDLEGAALHVDALLEHVGADGRLEGSGRPRLIMLTCYQVLARRNDARAASMLAAAHKDLEARALGIANDALKRSFLANIPEHREIVAAWAQAQTVRSA